MTKDYFSTRQLALLLSIFAASASSYCLADGTVIDKTYHPYVDALEFEIEFRSLYQNQETSLANPQQLHQLSIGKSFGEKWFAEAYLVGQKQHRGGFDLDAIELELKLQLTEQGEYAVDWGLLFEYENVIDADAQEFTVALLAEREFGRWSATTNLLLIQEWGDDIKDEFETALSFQTRYRYSRAFEPAVELYAGQGTLGIGPVFLGSMKLGVRKSIIWEAGLILGMDNQTPDQTFRFLLEYEF
ncbi:MAG: hypothetical protein ACI95C_002934 [Pseudohongiellaceae bacterium]|jgi:hypothetical protein